jgi:ABC-type Fe3+ transport system permease subunit
MDTIVAFAGTALFVLAFQTVHWVVRRRAGEARGWGEWLMSGPAWMPGWPVALSVGSYVVIYLLLQASRS